MAQKAKFKFLGTHELTAGIIVNDLELHDADNKVIRYMVTDFYSADKLKIVETTIAVLPDNSDCDSDAEFIDEDSYLGKQICNFLEGVNDNHQIPA